MKSDGGACWPDRFGQLPLHLDVEVNGDGGAAGERLQRRAQAALGQDGRVQAAGDLAQVLQYVIHPAGQAVQLLCYSAGPALPPPAVSPRGCDSAPLTRFLVCLLAGHTGDNLLAGHEQANT